MHRRRVLGALGTLAVTALGGCVLDVDPVRAGTLVIDNEHDRPHRVGVAVSKASENEDDVPPRPHDAPAPTGSVLWRRDRTFEVPASGRTREAGFIAEPGAFYVEVALDTGPTAATWLGLYAAGPEGEQVAEAYVAVDVYEDGRLNVGTPVDD